MIRKAVTVSLGIGLLWSGAAVALGIEQEERQHQFSQPIAQGMTAQNQGVPLPLPQPNPNLQRDSQILDREAQQAQQQSVADIIRQAQEYALVNDDDVGSPSYIYSTGGEQIGLDELNLSGWGGFNPYTLGF